jgi:DUF1009 family protein
MDEHPSGAPVAILAGGGVLPSLVARAAAEQGRAPIVFAIVGEADPGGFHGAPVHPVRIGEIGRILRLIRNAGCKEAVFIGSISRRPALKAIRPDAATLKLVPRILRLLGKGDATLLAGLAAILKDRGVTLVSPLAIAADLALQQGVVTGTVTDAAMTDAEHAAEAARAIGRLDIGQAAVAVRGRVIAVEDAGGTDELLRRVAQLREQGRIRPAGGVLVKCMKPQQDVRADVPTIGPETADGARRAGLDGVAGEAGRTMLAGRAETIEAFGQAGLFLLGLRGPERAASA